MPTDGLAGMLRSFRLPTMTGGSNVNFNFKWADNMQQPGDVLDFYVSGDVAPDGRFRYLYIAE